MVAALQSNITQNFRYTELFYFFHRVGKLKESNHEFEPGVFTIFLNLSFGFVKTKTEQTAGILPLLHQTPWPEI